MVDLTGERKNLQIEESQFKFGVSESFAQKLGRSVNFINNFQHSEKQFFANGAYNGSVFPTEMVDGLTVFQFDAEITQVYMFIRTAGTGGTTELDIKKSADNGTTWSTIFSTTPKIAFTAGNYRYIGIGGTLTGGTAPVLITPNFDAGDSIRLDIITAQTGNPLSTGILVHYRPR